jgi:hypothetical protein
MIILFEHISAKKISRGNLSEIILGSGSGTGFGSGRFRKSDPDPVKNQLDPQHCLKAWKNSFMKCMDIFTTDVM